MVPITIAMLVCLTALLVVDRIGGLFRQKYEHEDGIDRRHAEFAERARLDAMASQGVVPPIDLSTPARSLGQIELPDDLEAVAAQESETWAQDDLRLAMKEKFLKLHTGDSGVTWQKVRRAYGIGELP